MPLRSMQRSLMIHENAAHVRGMGKRAAKVLMSGWTVNGVRAQGSWTTRTPVTK
jgi:hypothetical protein